MFNSSRRRRATLFGVLVSVALVAAACGDSGSKTASTSAAATTAAAATSAAGTTEAGASTTAGGSAATTAAGGAVDPNGVSAAGIGDARCAANKAAGKITYISSFDFAAAASILEVVVAKEKGYFDKMCLDVDLKPGFSVANYPVVAANQAQFSSAGSTTELVNSSTGGAELVGFIDWGKSPVEALLVRDDGKINALTDLKGKTIGVKGDLPQSILAMLSQAGLKRGSDYKEVLLDGFDPKVHLQQPIDALPVFKSNEPGQLDAAGIKYKLFDPTTMNIPGSFGLLYTNKKFATDHPTAVEDFARAAEKGFEDAVANPDEAVGFSLKLINAAGNKNFLTQQGEVFRWQKESKLVIDTTPKGEPLGIIDLALAQAELDAYQAAGVFKTPPAKASTVLDDTIAKKLFDADGKLIWPAG